MTYSEMYNDYLTAYTDGTVTQIDDLISRVWMWDPPTALPTMYVPRPVLPVIAPHIETRFNRFVGHKFRLGGSKK